MNEAIHLGTVLNTEHIAWCVLNYFFVTHVSTAENSSRMEKKGLQTLLEKYSNSIKITTLTTVWHVQIRSFLVGNILKYYISLMSGTLESQLKKLYLRLQKKRLLAGEFMG